MSLITVFTTPQCPVCHNLITLLSQLKEKGLIDKVSVIDIANNSKVAEKYKFKSVPWLTIDHLFFHGEMLQSEILHWHHKLSEEKYIEDYIIWQLRKGQLPAVEMTLKHNPMYLSDIIKLLLNDKILLTTRIGIMAILESFEGSQHLHDLYPLMKQGMTHPDFRIRADVCQLLEMSSHPKAFADLVILSQDSHKDVRESATDALIDLGELEEYASGTLH